MSVLPILTEPDVRLRRVSQPVEAITQDLKQLLEDMAHTMKTENGIGLAAPQVGMLVRAVVMQVQEDAPLYTMLNPEIFWHHEEKVPSHEGCLSIPKAWGYVQRSSQVRVRFLTLDNVQEEHVFTDLAAKCIQHEVDHLNGILFMDHLPPLKRMLVLRMLRKRTS